MAGIVVGVDGSEESRDALRWGVEDGHRRKLPVTAVHIVDPQEAPNPHRAALGYVSDEATVRRVADDERALRDDLSVQARQRAEARLDAIIRETVPDEQSSVRRITLEDKRPGRALVGRARNADLLVVGSRGRGGFANLSLGSVSRYCVLHAPVPVVVIRAGILSAV